MRLFNVGWFPMRRDRNHVYCESNYAIHMYQYRCTLFIGDQRFSIAPGDITVTPPQTESRYELSGSGHHWCAHLSCDASHGRKLRLPLWQKAGAYTSALTQRLAWLAELSRMRGGPRTRLAEEGLETGVRDFLLWLHFQAAENKVLKGTRSQLAIETLVKELETRHDHNWSAKEQAAIVGMNANYLAQVFRKTYGCTIDHFLRRRRIEVAQHLLLSTTMRIKEVANSVGIPDPQKFNKDFRGIAGCSPSAFRLKVK